MGFHGGWMGMMRSDDQKPNITWGLLRRVLGYARPYHFSIVLMLFLILLSTGLGLISPLILRTLIDVTLPQKDINQLILLSLGLLFLPLISGFISVFMRRTSAQVGEGVIFDLRRSLFANLQRMSLRFFTNTRVGELMSRLNNDVVGAQNAVANTLVGIVTNLVQTVAVLAVMLALDWRLTIASLLIMPFFILAARILGNRLRLIAREQLEAIAQMNAMMNETLNIGGALLVKLFGRKQLEVERFTDRAQQVRDVGVKRAFTGSLFFAAVGLLSALGAAMIYGLGGYFVIQGALGIGTIVAFGSYLNNLYGSLQGLANAPVEFATSMVSFERVFEVIDLPVELGEKPDAVLLQDVQGTLAFEDVSFMYQDGDENLLSEVRRYGSMDQVEAVLSGKRRNGSEKEQDKEEPEAPQSQARGMALEHVSFVAHPGNLVALVGPSGAGKTTLTYLIPRLYDPSEGRITLDGIDLRDVNLDSLSTQIGMVTQETYLFHDTIRTNLQYARLNATQQELEDACRVANIDHFIRELPDGYDTIVGERGYRLSGGEKQRLALARVILKDPRLLVLDEATSSLDSESEALIQDALKQVMAGRTTIAIAHRLSTILAADLILVIDRGQVVERGTHAELLAVNGVYANLYRTQFNKQSESPA